MGRRRKITSSETKEEWLICRGDCWGFESEEMEGSNPVGKQAEMQAQRPSERVVKQSKPCHDAGKSQDSSPVITRGQHTLSTLRTKFQLLVHMGAVVVVFSKLLLAVTSPSTKGNIIHYLNHVSHRHIALR